MSFFVEFYPHVAQPTGPKSFEVPTFFEATNKVLEITGDGGHIQPTKSKEAGLIRDYGGLIKYHYFIWEM